MDEKNKGLIMDYYGNSMARYIRTLEVIPPTIAKNKNAKVLDIGGYSVFEEMLKNNCGFKDITTYATNDLNVNDLELTDSTFDLIILGEVIEHLYNPDHLLEECYRILKPAGALLVTTPNLLSWYNRILLLFGYYPMNLDISCEVRKLGDRDILNKTPLPNTVLNPLYDVHIKLYTFRTLEILLKAHKFMRLESHSYSLEKSAHYNIGYALKHINRIIGYRKSLAQGIIMIGWKT